jgi:hypothetical protein
MSWKADVEPLDADRWASKGHVSSSHLIECHAMHIIPSNHVTSPPEPSSPSNPIPHMI